MCISLIVGMLLIKLKSVHVVLNKESICMFTENITMANREIKIGGNGDVMSEWVDAGQSEHSVCSKKYYLASIQTMRLSM